MEIRIEIKDTESCIRVHTSIVVDDDLLSICPDKADFTANELKPCLEMMLNTVESVKGEG
jgi:hypothetical protein